MDVYLVPVGERYELYCEVPDEPIEVDAEAPPGFIGRQKKRFLDLLAEAERERRQAPADRATRGLGRVKASSTRRVAESIAEQRLLWHLRRQGRACLYYPDDIEEPPAVAMLRRHLRRDFEKHRFWLCIDSIGFVLSGRCFWCPVLTSSPTTSRSAWSVTTCRCAARARG